MFYFREIMKAMKHFDSSHFSLLILCVCVCPYFWGFQPRPVAGLWSQQHTGQCLPAKSWQAHYSRQRSHLTLSCHQDGLAGQESTTRVRTSCVSPKKTTI